MLSSATGGFILRTFFVYLFEMLLPTFLSEKLLVFQPFTSAAFAGVFLPNMPAGRSIDFSAEGVVALNQPLLAGLPPLAAGAVVFTALDPLDAGHGLAPFIFGLLLHSSKKR